MLRKPSEPLSSGDLAGLIIATGATQDALATNPRVEPQEGLTLMQKGQSHPFCIRAGNSRVLVAQKQVRRLSAGERKRDA